jgi:hypothetical protein
LGPASWTIAGAATSRRSPELLLAGERRGFAFDDGRQALDLIAILVRVALGNEISPAEWFIPV